jgi:N-acetylglucosaminyldiphosphoundecaprenol N-acetyl-beta-D-mannosaminyltransferase
MMVNILGVNFSTMTLQETVAMLEQAMSAPQKPLHIVTANPEVIMLARSDREMNELIGAADLVTPDGIGAVWASKYYGTALTERVTGMEISTALVEYAAKQGLGVYLLGAAPESNRLAIENLRKKYPTLRIDGHDGYFKPQDEARIIEKVRAFGPALLLVGLGNPRQEKFIYKYKHEMGAAVCIGIGGVIDIFAGTVKRAPKIFQDLKLEWFYRLMKQPSRWRRQLVLPRFVITVLTDKDRKKL